MNYWLVKSEPYKYPWDQLLKEDGLTGMGSELSSTQ